MTTVPASKLTRRRAVSTLDQLHQRELRVKRWLGLT